LVDAPYLFENLIDCDGVHAEIIAADRLPIIIGVGAWCWRRWMAAQSACAFGEGAANNKGIRQWNDVGAPIQRSVSCKVEIPTGRFIVASARSARCEIAANTQ
jgi:hypothetical protein